ncbi:Protein RcsF [Roseibacterium elongatum DSM 19469]|uniref:Protein RcsF n=1 Tax=Roseicyclus elongatus DSM 19469 TaxID=1294273 RepID=W8SPV9_9RHOB|nr:DUF1045 domain-containing protein [Roseibacterium elongatum]AHM04565.1 Protein RcsF [Roseibacterium elongatum DSM 19469]
MDRFKRYGIYAVPEGPLYRAGAQWLGWDSVTGTSLAQPEVAGLTATAAALTATPRKYGFHGTIKPPFRLTHPDEADALDAAARAFCATRSPVVIDRLELRRLGSFIAIVPATPDPALSALASATVEALDGFRAPASEAELAKRRKPGLSDRQEHYLRRWGYPYVMDAFRFHLTLTGKLPSAQAEVTRAALATHFAPVLTAPFVLDSLCLMGEDAEGMFHLLHRYTLAG